MTATQRFEAGKTKDTVEEMKQELSRLYFLLDEMFVDNCALISQLSAANASRRALSERLNTEIAKNKCPSLLDLLMGGKEQKASPIFNGIGHQHVPSQPNRLVTTTPTLGVPCIWQFNPNGMKL